MKLLAPPDKYVYHEKYLRLSKPRVTRKTVGKTNTFIELNGKRYNAHTGELIAHSTGSKPTTSHHKSGNPSVDGFVRPAHKATPSHPAKPAGQPAKAHTAPAKAASTTHVISDIHRPGAHHTVHHKQQHSQTLMRRAVKKPAPSLRRSVKVHTPRKDVLAKVPRYEIAAKLSVRHVDTKRLRRAERIAKNKLVSRFGHVDAPRAHHSAKAAHHTTHSTQGLPAISGVAGQSDIQTIRPVFAASATAIRQPSTDIFEQALARATSHKETYVSPKHAKKHAKRASRSFAKKFVRVSAASLAVLFLAGFIAYQNQANITMRLASSKAGFHASLPGYKPAGFATGTFKYSPGVVAVNYTSRSDNRSFNITQKVSNWNSETLLNEFVSDVEGKTYSTIEAAGRTIYTYGDNNATWVDKGVWYTIQSHGSLSTSQLVNIATSM